MKISGADSVAAAILNGPANTEFNLETNAALSDRLPHTMAIYDEGRGLKSLYLLPLDPELILQALVQMGVENQMVDITPRWGSACNSLMGPHAISSATPPIELVHDPYRSSRHSAQTLMADPHAVLPTKDHKIAISLHDRTHGVVYSHNPEALAVFVKHWLQQVLVTQKRYVTRKSLSLPAITVNDLAGLLDPLPPGQWWEPSLVGHSSFFTLDFVKLAAETIDEVRILDRIRWICRPEGSWRRGWWW